MVIWKLGYVILLLLLSMKCEMKALNVPEDSFHVDHKGKQGRICGPTRRSTKGQWTTEEDEVLRKAVEHFEGKNWKKIAECLKVRTDVQCLHRWQKVLHPGLVKGPWSKEEDNKIIALVEKYGPKQWSTISQHLPGRIGKQCRERWHNHLNPTINKNAWTQEEELILVRGHQIYGNKWAELTKFLPGRSDNSIKNHWNSSVKKNLDYYYSSGLLDQYQSLPLPNKSIVASSSWMQNKGDESNSKPGADVEESECSQYLNDLPEQQISKSASHAFQSSVRLSDQPSLPNLDTEAQTLECCSVCYESGNILSWHNSSSCGLRDILLFYTGSNDSIQDHQATGLEQVTSNGNEGDDDSVLEHHEYSPNDSSELDSFSSPTKMTKVFSPFFNCDLVNEVRQEYSPFGLRQVMNSPLLWDSHQLDIRKEKKLKRAKDFSHLVVDEGDDCKSSTDYRNGCTSPSKAKVSSDSASARLNRELNSVYEEPKEASESGRVTSKEASTANVSPSESPDYKNGCTSPSKAKVSSDSTSARLNRELNSVYEEPKEASESRGVISKEASTENDQETGSRPSSKVDTIVKDQSNQHKSSLPDHIPTETISSATIAGNKTNSAETSFNIEDFSIFDGTPFTKLLDSPSPLKSSSLFGSFLTSPKSPQEVTFEDMNQGERTYEAIELMKHLSEQTYEDTLEVLCNDTSESILKKREMNNKKSIQGKENQHQSHDQLVNQSQVEQRTLDFSDCETPRKASPGGYTSPSSYLLKNCR